MNIKNISFVLISSLSMSILSSCSLEGFASYMNEKYSEYVDNKSENEYSYDYSSTHSDTGDSIALLNEAFNGSVGNDGSSLRYDFTDMSKETSFTGANRLSFTKTIQELDYYDGCTPSTGKINGLVIPVDFIDDPASSIECKDVKADWQSVSSYYYNSSYGQLDIQYDILDWYTLSHKSSYYEKLKTEYSGDAPGVSAIINEVLNGLTGQIDFSKYDNNDDGYIDCLYIIYNHEIDYTNADFWWAYQYYYMENDKFDKVRAYNYMFAAYDFMFEDDGKCNARTFIHESGHLFGLEDYYDYDTQEGYNKGGLGGADIMDYTIGDHNPFSKMCLGWIKDPILVDLDSKESTTISIDSFENNGDTIMICDNYSVDNEIYQDYFLLIYFKNDRLVEDEYPYTKDGIRVYRIHGSLDTFTSEGTSYQKFKYDNSYTDYNLIDAYNNNSTRGEYARTVYTDKCAKDFDLYHEGSKANSLYYYSDQFSTKSSYSFVVDELADKATITFTHS